MAYRPGAAGRPGQLPDAGIRAAAALAGRPGQTASAAARRRGQSAAVLLLRRQPAGVGAGAGFLGGVILGGLGGYALAANHGDNWRNGAFPYPMAVQPAAIDGNCYSSVFEYTFLVKLISFPKKCETKRGPTKIKQVKFFKNFCFGFRCTKSGKSV